MITTVLFDFDGVIADSLKNICQWYEHAATIFNVKLPINSPEELIENFREPYPDFYEFLGFNWKRDQQKIFEAFVDFSRKCPTKPVEGIEFVIRELANTSYIRMGIVSSNEQGVLEKHLDEFGMTNDFDIVIGVDRNLNSPLKPDPTSLLKAVDHLGASLSETVYIGDQPSDVLTARNASQVRSESQMKTISVTTGFATREKLENTDPRADFIIDHPTEILEKLDLVKN